MFLKLAIRNNDTFPIFFYNKTIYLINKKKLIKNMCKALIKIVYRIKMKTILIQITYFIV